MLTKNHPTRRLNDPFDTYAFKTHPWYLRETINADGGLNNRSNYTNQDPIEPGTTPIDLCFWSKIKPFLGDGLPFISLPIEWSKDCIKGETRTKNYFKFNNLFLKNDPQFCRDDNRLETGANMSVGFIGAKFTGRSFLVVSHSLIQNRPVLDMRGMTDLVLDKFHIEQILEYCLATPYNTIIVFDLTSAKPRLNQLIELIQNKKFPLNEHRQFVYIVEKEHQLPTSVPSHARFLFPGNNDDKFLVWKYHMSKNLFNEEKNTEFIKNLKKFSNNATDFRALKLLDSDFNYDDYSGDESKKLQTYMRTNKSDRSGEILMKLLTWNEARIRSVNPDAEIVKEYPEREQWRREFPSLLKERFLKQKIHTPKYISSFLHRVFPVGVLPKQAVDSLVFTLKNYESFTHDKTFALNLHRPANLQNSGKIMVTTKEIDEQLNFVLPTIYPCKRMKYDHKDYKQLISTVHDQQKMLGNKQEMLSDQQKTIDDLQKTISDQQSLISRLSVPAGSQLISGTTITSTSTIDETNATTASVATTTTTNSTQITGPLCNRCHKNNVTSTYKSDQRWKSRCNLCLSKIRTTNNKRKRAIQ
jgi:hypothetical protein